MELLKQNFLKRGQNVRYKDRLLLNWKEQDVREESVYHEHVRVKFMIEKNKHA